MFNYIIIRSNKNICINIIILYTFMTPHNIIVPIIIQDYIFRLLFLALNVSRIQKS